MHVTPAFSFSAGEEACTRRSSSSSSRPRIAAPADRSNASAVLAAGGGAARLLAEAGSCLAISFAGAEAEAIGSELLLRRPRGRETQARQSADVCLSLLSFSRAHYKILQKSTKYRKKQAQWYILGKVRGTKDQLIDQPTNDKMFGP